MTAERSNKFFQVISIMIMREAALCPLCNFVLGPFSPNGIPTTGHGPLFQHGVLGYQAANRRAEYVHAEPITHQVGRPPALGAPFQDNAEARPSRSCWLDVHSLVRPLFASPWFSCGARPFLSRRFFAWRVTLGHIAYIIGSPMGAIGGNTCSMTRRASQLLRKRSCRPAQQTPAGGREIQWYSAFFQKNQGRRLVVSPLVKLVFVVPNGLNIRGTG